MKTRIQIIQTILNNTNFLLQIANYSFKLNKNVGIAYYEDNTFSIYEAYDNEDTSFNEDTKNKIITMFVYKPCETNLTKLQHLSDIIKFFNTEMEAELKYSLDENLIDFMYGSSSIV